MGFLHPAQTRIWLKLFVGTKVLLGDDNAVTILSGLLTFSPVGGMYTLDCVQMWKTEKSVTDFNPSEILLCKVKGSFCSSCPAALLWANSASYDSSELV